jgi:hypothetical protein
MGFRSFRDSRVNKDDNSSNFAAGDIINSASHKSICGDKNMNSVSFFFKLQFVFYHNEKEATLLIKHYYNQKENTTKYYLSKTVN